jgi:hypothetical protein
MIAAAARSKARHAPHAGELHNCGVNAVDQRHVDVENVAIRNGAPQELVGNKMENRGIADERPVQRAPQQPSRDHGDWQVEDGNQRQARR